MNKVAIYCRLSKEDLDKKSEKESESIQNQKNMLVSYAIERNWEIYQIYCDDDYSGADENRPNYNKLLFDAEKRKFDIVLCKMQSRFTRDMEHVEKYINNKFKEWNIRFVSIVDNSDTDIKSNKKNRQINGLVNEWYLEDLSENIRAVLNSKKKAGAFVGAFAPYGYKKDCEDKNRLVVDEPAAKVVKRIFSMYLNGYGLTRIAEKLNEEGVISPSEYKIQNGSNYKKRNRSVMRFYWTDSSVNSILKSQTYIGDTVQGKSTTVSYKNQKRIRNPKSDWIIVENTHEPIIDRETFKKINQISSKKSRPQSNGQKHIFAGLLKCECCGSALVKHYSRNKIYFQCRLKKNSKADCNGTSVNYEMLYEIILIELNQIVKKYVSTSEITKILDITMTKDHKKNELNKEIKDIGKKLIECNDLILELYKNTLIKKTISDYQFEKLNQQFLEEIKTLKEKKSKLNKELIVINGKNCDLQTTKEKLIVKYLNLKELNSVIIRELIKCIVIGNTEKIGVKNIMIYWNF